MWNSCNEQMFTSVMCTSESCAMLYRAIDLIDLYVDKTLNSLNRCIKEKADYMKKQIRINKRG